MGLFDNSSEAEKLALMEIESFRDDNHYKFRKLCGRYGVKKVGLSDGRYFNKIIKTIKKEIINDGLTIDGIVPRVHEFLTEKYGKPYDYVDFEIDESILSKSPQEQKEYLLKTGEYIIYLQIVHIGEMKKAGRTYTRPKGLTDVIGGAFGNTGIRMETVSTAPEFTNGFAEWRERMIYLHDDKFSMSNYNATVSYEDIVSVTVDKESQSNMGLLIKIDAYRVHKLTKDKERDLIEFRTPIALGLEAFLKEKMPKKDTPKDNASDADALMKYAELYEKGLLTEEEFNAKKKEILGL